MRYRIVFILLFIIPGIVAFGQSFDKADFYTAMASENVADINTRLIMLKKTTIKEKEAYEGALLMKKAGLISKPVDKLNVFKSGRTKLEAAIKKENENGEYHFLRLMIQENAPGIVKYHSDLEKDSNYVRNAFKSQLPVVQHAIIEYSKKSKVLKPADF